RDVNRLVQYRRRSADDPEPLDTLWTRIRRTAYCVATRDEVEVVARVEPDLVGTSQVLDEIQWGAGKQVDDDYIPMPIGRFRIAAFQDLAESIGDSHSLRARAEVDVNPEHLLNSPCGGIDHRDPAGRCIIAGAVDLRNVLIKPQGHRTKPTLL